ncbi:MAG TPA: cyclopropane-fatty-acyl-phospholipid synthase family protein [Sphingomonas sp.]|jgi:cyclopropane-fatty-acyl-phospholipid synthase|uniref:cyclopropane-fatty-acyl-phospholipid synthase family protein n=1 Tax=Sphingomonas sp. TaxID=28214 RepID=UPI002ED8CEE4
MNADTPRRGDHLVRADRGFATGGGRLSRWLAPAFHRVLDRVDRGLAEGAIEATLPDGRQRVLGGRAPGPVAIVTLHDWRPLMRLILSGSVGWYRSWADGEWSSPDPVPLFDLFMRNRAALGATARAHGWGRIVNRALHAWRRNDTQGSRRNIAFHYDLGNDFYAAWLDPGMTYSSALFGVPGEPLEQAQRRKIGALLDRLATRPGDRMLEIGCGWGSLAAVAARDYGLVVTGLTLSAEQKALADARLAGDAEIVLRDYREETGVYDAVASVEMVEAVGQEYWPAYMRAIARALKPGGRAAIQYIAIDDAIFDRYAASADFIQTYVFPGGMLISESRFRAAAAAAGLEWRDRTGFGLHYAETLKIWRGRFDAAVAEGRLPAGFDDRFVRLWRYYLMYCEGGFRGGGIDVAQVTLVRR